MSAADIIAAGWWAIILAGPLVFILAAALERFGRSGD